MPLRSIGTASSIDVSNLDRPATNGDPVTLTAETLTPADAAVGSLVHALAEHLDPAVLHAAVQQALLAAEIHLGDAVYLGELVPDVIAAEVWHGEAVMPAAEALRVGMGYVAAALVAGAHP